MAASWRLVLAAVILLTCCGTVAGCADGCGDMSCGSGVVVWWAPGDVPDASGYRLCIGGACESVEPGPVGDTGRYLSVAPSSATSEDDVVVDLKLLDYQGRSVAVFRGAGSKTGRCCPGVAFRASASGELVVDPI